MFYIPIKNVKLHNLVQESYSQQSQDKVFQPKPTELSSYVALQYIHEGKAKVLSGQNNIHSKCTNSHHKQKDFQLQPGKHYTNP